MGYIRAGVGRLRKLLSGQHSGHDPGTAPAPGREKHPLIPPGQCLIRFYAASTPQPGRAGEPESHSQWHRDHPPSNGPTYFPLTVGHLDLSYESDILNDPLYVNGRNSPMIGLELVITDPHHSLLSLHGEWTLTILPSAIPGSKVPWVFHFTVPA